MPQSLVRIYIHAVFSTKDRAPLISDEWQPDMHSYIGGILRNRKCHFIAAGGIEDHMHLLFRMPATAALSDMIRDVKSNSSAWRHENGDRRFAWQNGYGAFSVGPTQVPDVVEYIGKQRQHHAKVSFRDEYLAFLHKYQIEYDER
jgi:REP element-mobilizing transposase RayT